MKRILVVGAGLVLLAGCGSPGAVGENSPDSIRTTAEGKIVGTVPSATPTPDATLDNAATLDLNAASAAAADAADTAAAASNDTSGHGE